MSGLSTASACREDRDLNGPPILIGASRPRMLRLTAELADAWTQHLLAGARRGATSET